MMYFMWFLVPTIISTVLYFPVSFFAIKFKIYAHENNRTIHHGNIPRIGGVAIYIAFIVSILYFFEDYKDVLGMLLGGSIVFFEGFLDDVKDVKPIVKLVAQFLAATCFLFIGGKNLPNLHLLFGFSIPWEVVAYIIAYLWLVGITNAINLIDGLDGLAAGFSIIVLITISLLNIILGNLVFALPVCLILAGSTLGFLFFNFNPARIFMGDCGAQFLGFMIACISLVGYRSTTFITLIIPILLLFIPISDTMLAIIRRKLNGKSIMSADSNHLHHVLMKNMKLGQKGAVLVIYFATIMFGIDAYLFVVDRPVGILLLVMIVLVFDIFIEYTGMVSSKYRPLLNLMDKFKQPFDNGK